MQSPSISAGGAVAFGSRISALATEHPDATAVTLLGAGGVPDQLTWRELDERSNRYARLFLGLGLTERSTVAVGLRNSLEHVIAAIAVWKLGACVLPFNPDWEPPYRDQTLEPAQPSLILVARDEPRPDTLTSAGLRQAESLSSAPLPDRIAAPGKAIATGGSTGRPKILVDPNPWTWSPDALARKIRVALGMRSGQKHLVAGPLFLNAPFMWLHYGLCDGHEIILMTHFDAREVTDVVARYGVAFMWLSPSMMREIVSTAIVTRDALSSIEALVHTGGPCPGWVKRRWLELLDPTCIYEAYGATEGVGMTAIRGDEWLKHPGSVGRPLYTDVSIRDSSGDMLEAGKIGHIFMRWSGDWGDGLVHRYLGSAAPIETDADSFHSVGDLGWLDADGFLYLGERAKDVVSTEAGEVYPSEVESVLTEHPRVHDAAVIGVEEPGTGTSVVHAIIQPADLSSPPTVDELRRHCESRLDSRKVPVSYECVERLPRQESGKLNRSALRRSSKSTHSP